MTAIADSRILILATNGFEQAELEVPRTELSRRGATVHLATPDGEDIRGWNRTDWGDTVSADRKLSDVRAEDYDAVVLPGGQINPDLLRVNADAVALVRSFFETGRVVAAICHAPWLLIEAGIAEGRRLTSYPSVRTDLVNAGADWVDEPVVADNGVVTSRRPDDLEAFVGKIVEEIEEGRHRRAAA